MNYLFKVVVTDSQGIRWNYTYLEKSADIAAKRGLDAFRDIPDVPSSAFKKLEVKEIKTK